MPTKRRSLSLNKGTPQEGTRVILKKEDSEPHVAALSLNGRLDFQGHWGGNNLAKF